MNENAPHIISLEDGQGERRHVEPSPELSLAQAGFLAGLWRGQPLCSGLGRCGRCRVRFESPPPTPTGLERVRLDGEELSQGVRLACLHPALPGIRASLLAPPPAGARITPASPVAIPGPLDLAVDLGTTGIAWAARDAAGTIVAAGSCPNPQLGAGSEVVSRLAFALRGHGDTLREVVLETLTGIVAGLPSSVGRMALAGNPSMILLLLGLSVEGLSRAPYRLSYHGGDVVTLAPDLPPCYLPPLAGPFIGADVVAGAARLLTTAPGAPAATLPFLLADLGTNGEFALVRREGMAERCTFASVPMGPALEGVGLTCGRTAGSGAVVAVGLTPAGLAFRLFEDDPARPPFRNPAETAGADGLSGTGYLSLLAALLACGVLDEYGRFVRDPASPLGRKVAVRIAEVHGEIRLGLTDRLYLAAIDVEEVLKVKAACNLALKRLTASLSPEDARGLTLHLAGALGEHARPSDLERLGFLPPECTSRTVVAGNTSLAGTLLLIDDVSARDTARELAERAELLDLTDDPAFGREYLDRMVFRYVR